GREDRRALHRDQQDAGFAVRRAVGGSSGEDPRRGRYEGEAVASGGVQGEEVRRGARRGTESDRRVAEAGGEEGGEEVTPEGLVLCDDLIFFSRISGAARAAGRSVRQAKSAAEVIALARQHAPGGVILDLQNPGLDLPAVLAELTAICP